MGFGPVTRFHYNYSMLDYVIDIGGIFGFVWCYKEITVLAALLPFCSQVDLWNRLMRCFELPVSIFLIRDVLAVEKLVTG